MRIIHHTKVPSFVTLQKKQEETKRKRTYLKTQHFLPILSIERMLFYYLRRPFYGFCFCFQYWPSRLCGPGGLSSWAWMPQPKMPGRVPREVDLFSSYPFPLQQLQRNTRNDRNGVGKVGGGKWPRQAWRGGGKSREDGSENGYGI